MIYVIVFTPTMNTRKPLKGMTNVMGDMLQKTRTTKSMTTNQTTRIFYLILTITTGHNFFIYTSILLYFYFNFERIYRLRINICMIFLDHFSTSQSGIRSLTAIRSHTSNIEISSKLPKRAFIS